MYSNIEWVSSGSDVGTTVGAGGHFSWETTQGPYSKDKLAKDVPFQDDKVKYFSPCLMPAARWKSADEFALIPSTVSLYFS